ncbi:MAG: Unknown protein, partial [uncultured Thiotrichaceae bacterium]
AIFPSLPDVTALLLKDGIEWFGERELSPNIIKRLEEVTGLDVSTLGFPVEMTEV